MPRKPIELLPEVPSLRRGFARPKDSAGQGVYLGAGAGHHRATCGSQRAGMLPLGEGRDDLLRLWMAAAKGDFPAPSVVHCVGNAGFIVPDPRPIASFDFGLETPVDVFKIYKYQPRIEKRQALLKSTLKVAPTPINWIMD
jgi:hypothetical protein